MHRLSVPLGIAAVVSLAFGVHEVTASTDYTLTESSRYSNGCFELCACPLAFSGVAGSLVVVPAGSDGSFEVFQIPSVKWNVPLPALQVSGSGTYRIDRNARIQRLALDLRVGEQDVQHFDSGLVGATVDFPAIDALIAIHGAPACIDTRFEIRAVPEGLVAIEHAPWTVIKALYSRP